MNMRHKKLLGFTLVELMVVVAVIGILSAIGIVAFNVTRQNAITTTMQSDLRGAASALKQYYLQNGSYPSNLSTVDGGHGPVTSGNDQYTYSTGSSNTTYCLAIASSGVSNTFHVSSVTTVPKAGSSCAGDAWPTPAVLASIASVGTELSILSSSSISAHVPVPPGVVAGSLVVIMTIAYDGSSSPDATTGPIGFTLGEAAEATESGNTLGFQWWYKYATGADTGTYNLTFPAGTVNAYAMRITGGPTSGNPFETLDYTEATWTTTIEGAATLTAPSLMILGYDSGGYVTSDGWTQAAAINTSTTGDIIGIISKYFSSAGPISNTVFSSDGSAYGAWAFGSWVAIPNANS